MRRKNILFWVALIGGWTVVALAAIQPATPTSSIDDRFCGPPSRDAAGRIVRSQKVLADFERLYPRPGPTWYKDHVIPMSCGGCDTIINIQWLTRDQWADKSRWERKVYGGHGISKGCP